MTVSSCPSGSGEPSFSIASVRICHLASAHVAAFDRSAREPRTALHEIFNVGTGRGTAVLDTIRAFEAATAVALRHRIGPDGL
jgi:UDP-glucose 4-epimerase